MGSQLYYFYFFWAEWIGIYCCIVQTVRLPNILQSFPIFIYIYKNKFSLWKKYKEQVHQIQLIARSDYKTFYFFLWITRNNFSIFTFSETSKSPETLSHWKVKMENEIKHDSSMKTSQKKKHCRFSGQTFL